MPIQRTDIPDKARNRSAVPWRLSIGKELTGEELQAVVTLFLDGTSYHYVIQANVYPGLTMIDGDYWPAKGRRKDLSQVARRWDDVEEKLPELIVDAVLEYRVPSALLDEVAPLAVDDLTHTIGTTH